MSNTGMTDETAASSEAISDPNDYSFLYGLARAPCFRETALYSIGGGAVLGALHFQRNRMYLISTQL